MVQAGGTGARGRAIAVQGVGGARGRRAHISGPAGTDRSGTRPLAVHPCTAKSVVTVAAVCSCPAKSTRPGRPRQRRAHRGALCHPCATRCTARDRQEVHAPATSNLGEGGFTCRARCARRGREGLRRVIFREQRRLLKLALLAFPTLSTRYLIHMLNQTKRHHEPRARLGVHCHRLGCYAFAAACCRRSAGSSGLHSALQRFSGQ